VGGGGGGVFFVSSRKQVSPDFGIKSLRNAGQLEKKKGAERHKISLLSDGILNSAKQFLRLASKESSPTLQLPRRARTDPSSQE